jgi:predicted lipoprotein with Yx(FWY)xxD motif
MENMMSRFPSSWRPLVAVASFSLLAACASHPIQQSQANNPPSHAPAMMMQTTAGSVMTTPTGMTLYTFDKDAVGKSNCNGECAQYWPPLIANPGSIPAGYMTLITRDDGQMQWAAHGSPLYTYVQDRAPGDVNGNNFRNDWHVVL